MSTSNELARLWAEYLAACERDVSVSLSWMVGDALKATQKQLREQRADLAYGKKYGSLDFKSHEDFIEHNERWIKIYEARVRFLSGFLDALDLEMDNAAVEEMVAYLRSTEAF